ncbi:MAG: amidohydrolase family protein [Anaerolineales bacterium]|nr:amidohydrolase family protein [Anaerolineales bacterium]
MLISLPGLIDPHVHMREPGQTHKEDWRSGTAAALAGGFTCVLAMPNTHPPVVDLVSLDEAETAARKKSLCDYGLFLGAGSRNGKTAAELAPKTAGLKMYLDLTFGALQLKTQTAVNSHMANWPADKPIVVHAEGRKIAMAIQIAARLNRGLHIAHVSRKSEILLIKAAKEKGVKVTCEATPHHLLLTKEDLPRIGAGRGEVRPRLAAKADQQALWENLAVIDCFATDHAPHTLDEKDGKNPPPGFPGLETALALLLTAVHEGRLTVEDVLQRMHDNPRRIFSIPEQLMTMIQVDLEARWTIRGEYLKTRCAWTPFEGWNVRGRVMRVDLRGVTAYDAPDVTVEPGFGRNISGGLAPDPVKPIPLDL